MEKFALSANIRPYEVFELKENIHILVTGPGSPSAIYYLTDILSRRTYDLLIQTGLAGSFNPEIKPGQLVEVEEDCFADIGVDDRGKFRQLFDIGLSDPDLTPYSQGRLVNPSAGGYGLPQVKAITVNTVSGSETLIRDRIEMFNPDIETMEGAAFFYVCLQKNIPCIQLRSISNIVEPRNKDAWEMDNALENLNNWLFDFVNNIG
jgi:futalosine hydrolase